MYKIYIGATPLCLVTEEEAKNYDRKDLSNLLVKHPKHQKKYILRYIDTLENQQNRYKSIIIRTDELERLWEEFRSYYKIMEAAGGVVRNEKGEVLGIYRSGVWDLPKGKIEKGETEGEAAIREIQEETGLNEVDLGDKITTTYHTYKNRKGNRVLKVSHWFHMTTTETELTPQVEEDIEKAEWLSLENLKNQTPIYQNILDVLGLS